MFLNLGFKSVTMDDIARTSGVSKKTIYAHFSNKTDLVEAVTSYLFDTVCCGIDLIHEQQQNPIIELFEIKKFVMQHLKDEKSSPQYQLQKYYPKIFVELKQKQFEVMQESNPQQQYFPYTHPVAELADETENSISQQIFIFIAI